MLIYLVKALTLNIANPLNRRPTMKLSWLLVFKVFITLFWTLSMIGFILVAIDNRKTFLEILNTHWDIFAAILLGCISVILDFIFKEKNIMLSYFFIFFFT